MVRLTAAAPAMQQARPISPPPSELLPFAALAPVPPPAPAAPPLLFPPAGEAESA
jgi:hypothetical protein